MTASALSGAKRRWNAPLKRPAISQPSALDAQIQDSMQKFWSTIAVPNAQQLASFAVQDARTILISPLMSVHCGN